MDPELRARYYLAIVASGLSVAGWLGAGIFGLYAGYLLIAEELVYWPIIVVLILFSLGIAFALIEKALYQKSN